MATSESATRIISINNSLGCWSRVLLHPVLGLNCTGKSGGTTSSFAWRAQHVLLVHTAS